MEKIRLGGIKIAEGRSCLHSFCRKGEDTLAGICYRMRMQQLNIALLTHMGGSHVRGGLTSVSTDESTSFSSYFLLKLDYGNTVGMEPQVCLVSIFPHNERAEVLGALFRCLAQSGIFPHCIASSPSAITSIVSSLDTRKAIDALFDSFEFPTYKSPLDWYAAYQGKEQAFKEIICSYQEKVIKVYNITCRQNLEIVELTLPAKRLDELGAALQDMGKADVRLPFIIGQAGLEENYFVSCCISGMSGREAKILFGRSMPGVEVSSGGPVSALFMHGPHFGDRYGIASALAGGLQEVSVAPLALSCAVSSVSLVVRAEDEERSLAALKRRFQVPAMEEAEIG